MWSQIAAFNSQMASKLRRIESHLSSFFEETPYRMWPHLTIHDLRHSKNIIRILYDMTKGVKEGRFCSPLTRFEVFCLLSASMFHDVGMFIRHDDDEQVLETRRHKEESVTLFDIVRENHHERSKDYVEEQASSLGLPKKEALVIGLLCRGHRGKMTMDVPDQNDQDDNPVRMSALCALLRLADELDIDHERAPLDIMNIIELDMDDISKMHWLKHQFVKKVVIKTDRSIRNKVVVIPEFILPPKDEAFRETMIHCITEPIRREIEATRKTLLNRLGLFATMNQLDKIPSPEIESKLQASVRKIWPEIQRFKKKYITTAIDPFFGKDYYYFASQFDSWCTGNDIVIAEVIRPRIISPSLWETDMAPPAYKKTSYDGVKDRFARVWCIEFWDLNSYVDTLIDEYEHSTGKRPHEMICKRLNVLFFRVLQRIREGKTRVVLISSRGVYKRTSVSVITGNQLIFTQYRGAVIAETFGGVYFRNLDFIQTMYDGYLREISDLVNVPLTLDSLPDVAYRISLQTCTELLRLVHQKILPKLSIPHRREVASLLKKLDELSKNGWEILT